MKDNDADKVRVDKWLWAARFYKTRSLATDAVEAGHVHLNGERPKPARALKPGDRLRIYATHGEFEVVVKGLSGQRGPAAVAVTLYEETPESLARRAQSKELQAMAPHFDHPDVKGRPTKKWRRELSQFQRKQGRD
ncbi:ribosome-associated heat shock protein Hsp15 [Andreprevotia lacus DSM 23236]|jgi:ribosome-associated heat shock protein Hsp15|uniref:Ribosome-associated heat shock protein Hsp15 n=1 Tax=Andreprevotia lacus DSM 23236 TaxID=1121001 RepID=A0A1W1XPL7_9NEIS|nr:S4 domain-containing protein [Andreprevotia lacus]SMC25805.1 ribosome-associated heat shock protein Hsp15 [Andreprevotia lacus DSM 23236]